MLFRDKEHEIRWGDMLMSVIRQDPLHRAVYYLIALAGLLLGDWYDEVNDRIKIERLRAVDLDWSSRCAVALAYDILNKDKGTNAFPLLSYSREWLPYFVVALEMCHDYTVINYAKVYIVNQESGSIVERFRFSETLQALLFGSYLYGKIDSRILKIQIWDKGDDLSFIVEEGKKTYVPNLTNHRKHVCDERKAKEDKLAFELQLRYSGMQYEIDLKDPILRGSDFWPDDQICYTYQY